MLENLIAGIVDGARRYAAFVILFFLAMTVVAFFIVSERFAINTDVASLLDAKAVWRQNEIAFSRAFPQRDDLIVVVIDGKSAAATENAAEMLAAALVQKKALFRSVKRPEANAYFQKNGLLLLPDEELAVTLEQLSKAQPLLGSLAADNSPKGLFAMMGMMLQGLEAGQTSTADITPLFKRLHEALSRALKNPADETAWRYLLASENPGKFELRRFVLAQPKLDYSTLSPGAAASDFIRAFVKENNLETTHDVRVRLTGGVVLSDEEFASISEGMTEATIGSFLLILLILFLALRSWRLIVPIFIVLICGLLITTAFALLTVKALNLISVAFAVMFTGIAVDFGIQFGVRCRDVRFHFPDLHAAMKRTGALVAVPLLLAALSTAAGFLSFTPTSYRGVAELGLIAGAGMIIAFILNITLLPALLRLSQPGPEKEAVGYRWAAPLDDFLLKHRKKLLQVFTGIFVASLCATFFLRFDFDPLNLKNPKSESVATMFELVNDPDSNPYTVDILAKNLDEAAALAAKLRSVPEVDKVLTLHSFVPENQEEKAMILSDTAGLLGETLALIGRPDAPVKAGEQKAAARLLLEKMAPHKELGADADALRGDLKNILALDDDTLLTLARSFRHVIGKTLADIKARFTPVLLTLADLPTDLRNEWVAPDGTTRLEVYPKGNARDPDVLIRFVAAIQKEVPGATGTPVSIQESAKTIKRAFVEAAIYSVLIIFFLLLIILRSLKDSLFVLAPLILAASLTLGTAALTGLAINFANIIALPLLLGLGVSYSIYFVVYWRQGFEKPLQSSMARAVLFSAATAVVAFGSLSLSNHPGTASMGLLLTLSLFYVLFTSLFFLPCLLGDSLKYGTKVTPP